MVTRKREPIARRGCFLAAGGEYTWDSRHAVGIKLSSSSWSRACARAQKATGANNRTGTNFPRDRDENIDALARAFFQALSLAKKKISRIFTFVREHVFERMDTPEKELSSIINWEICISARSSVNQRNNKIARRTVNGIADSFTARIARCHRTRAFAARPEIQSV